MHGLSFPPFPPPMISDRVSSCKYSLAIGVTYSLISCPISALYVSSVCGIELSIILLKRNDVCSDPNIPEISERNEFNDRTNFNSIISRKPFAILRRNEPVSCKSYGKNAILVRFIRKLFFFGLPFNSTENGPLPHNLMRFKYSPVTL